MSFAAAISALSGSTDAGLWDMTADTYQTSGGSAAGDTDPVGSWLDGINGYEFLQSTAADRPILSTTNGLNFDGTGDSLTCSDFPSLTSMTDHVVLMRLRTTDAAGVLLRSGPPQIAGTFESGNGSATYASAGTPTTTVDGAALSANTRGGLYTDLCDGTVRVVRIYGIDFTSWSSNLQIMFYVSPTQFRVAGDLERFGVCSVSDYDANQSAIDTWIGLSAGAYTLPASVGAFTLTGVAAGLELNAKLTAALGEFTLTGIAAGLNTTMPAETGDFTITGIDATLARALSMTADVGDLTLTGVDAVLSRSIVLTADVGNFTLTGNDAGLQRHLIMAAEPAALTLTGIAADLVFAGDVSMDAETGVFLLTGNDARLAAGDDDYYGRMQLFMKMWRNTTP